MRETPRLPLTLTLSPRAGRGDAPCDRSKYAEDSAASPSPRLRGEGGGSRMRGGHVQRELTP